MTAEDGVGRDDARDLTKETSPDGSSFHCRSSTLLIGETHSLLAEQLPERAVLFHHIASRSVSGAGGNRTPVQVRQAREKPPVLKRAVQNPVHPSQIRSILTLI